MNAVKDGYVWTIDRIEDHPHVAFWAIAVLALLAVLF